MRALFEQKMIHAYVAGKPYDPVSDPVSFGSTRFSAKILRCGVIPTI